jgi:hypothetical protein
MIKAGSLNELAGAIDVPAVVFDYLAGRHAAATVRA